MTEGSPPAAPPGGSNLHAAPSSAPSSGAPEQAEISKDVELGTVKAPPSPSTPIATAQAPNAPPSLDGTEGEGYVRVTYWDIFKQFFIMGWIGFGGPAAHIGLFERTFVTRLRWMSSQVFMELFSLGQCLPGPTSTQVSFAMGIVKKGVWGGLLSGIMFQYPGAIIMTAAGAGAAEWLTNPEPWLDSLVAGVSAVGVAMVAAAAKGLLMKMCAPTDRSKSAFLLPDLPCSTACTIATRSCARRRAAEERPPPPMTPDEADAAHKAHHEAVRKAKLSNTLNTAWSNTNAILATLAAGAAIYWSEPWMFPLAIIIGFIVTNITERRLDLTLKSSDGGVESLGVGMIGGAILIGTWIAVLVTVLVLARTVYEDGNGPLNWFEVFYRIGSIIYGGGQVVLPMLVNDLVKTDDQGNELPDTWVTTKQFYAGLGAVQAMPGPLFNFSAYLGAITAMNFNYTFILGAVLAWFGLFSPGILLMFGVLPYWKKFRTWQVYRRGLPGMNAVGVGLILASVFTMTMSVYKDSPFPTASLVIGLFAFAAVDELKIFEPWVVIGGGLLGLLAWGCDLR